MLEEKLGYRKYDIEPIIDKFYSFLERELKKFGETDDEDRAQKFDDYIKSKFAKLYDKGADESDCLFIGTFKGTDYVVKIYIGWFLESASGAFLEDLSNLKKHECVVFLNDNYIKYFVNDKSKLIFDTLRHEIRHAEDWIRGWMSSPYGESKLLFDIEGKTKEFKTVIGEFEYSDECIRLVTYYLSRVEMNAFLQSFNETIRRICDKNDSKVMVNTLKKYKEKKDKTVKFTKFNTLLSNKVDGRPILIDILSNAFQLFRVYFNEVHYIMSEYDLFKNYLIKAVMSKKNKGCDFAYWFFAIMNGQWCKEKQQKKMRKKLLDYINKGIREGMNADEGLEFFVENEYSQMLYNFLKKQYDGFIHKIMSNVIEVVADYEDSQGAIDAVKKYEIFKAEEK